MKLASNDFVAEQIQRKLKKYSEYPEDIISEYRREEAELKGYHGRELLELIQNAVDEMKDVKEKAIDIIFYDNRLVISNNGTTFTEDGILSVFNSHLSPKHQNQEYIGNKGTGFRSLLN